MFGSQSTILKAEYYPQGAKVIYTKTQYKVGCLTLKSLLRFSTAKKTPNTSRGIINYLPV